MAGAKGADRAAGLAPGWDRWDPWTLRFLDPGLEQAYMSAMAAPGRLRLRIACLLGSGIWLFLAFISPILGVAIVPFLIAAVINAGWETAVVTPLTFRGIDMHRVSTLAFVTSTFSALGIVYAFGTGDLFVTVGAAALATNAAFGIGLVRPAGWVAAAISLMEVVLFVVIVLAFDVGGTGTFQAFLLIGTLVGVTIGTRYLEEAERSAFAQGRLVADLHGRIDRLFRQYLSPDVAQALVDDPSRADLGGEVVDVSVLFADLQGFTPFSERTPAPEVVAMLNNVFSAAVPAVFAEGGTVVQFMGDALMAVFNAPLRQPDHALRACRAGLALQRSMGMVESAADGPRFRVGINSGPALVGNVGSAELHNFLAIGDTTNVAARLQSFAKTGTVVLGEKTYELVRDDVEVRLLGAPELKGKSLATNVYELICLRSTERLAGSPASSEVLMPEEARRDRA
jgi:class 3 adenylate cyclase